MPKTNTTVLCPVDGCKEVFDNRERFTKHVTESHKMEDVVTDVQAKE